MVNTETMRVKNIRSILLFQEHHRLQTTATSSKKGNRRAEPCQRMTWAIFWWRQLRQPIRCTRRRSSALLARSERPHSLDHTKIQRPNHFAFLSNGHSAELVCTAASTSSFIHLCAWSRNYRKGLWTFVVPSRHSVVFVSRRRWEFKKMKKKISCIRPFSVYFGATLFKIGTVSSRNKAVERWLDYIFLSIDKLHSFQFMIVSPRSFQTSVHCHLYPPNDRSLFIAVYSIRAAFFRECACSCTLILDPVKQCCENFGQNRRSRVS